MIDTMTHKSISVSVDGDSGPYIMVPIDQLAQLRELLGLNEIAHWVEGDAISLDGRPAVAVINLGLRGDPVQVQAILDQVG